jgi:hypothetical protein
MVGDDDDVLWMGPATGPNWGEALGQTVLKNVHSPRLCAGRHCVLHNPSNHHMVTWPTMFRSDVQFRYMERTCEHGVGHPDPDDIAYFWTSYKIDISIHGCDGCCVPPTIDG